MIGEWGAEMRPRKLVFLLAMAMGVVLVATLLSLRSRPDSSTVTGMVVDETGRGIAGAVVRVQSTSATATRR